MIFNIESLTQNKLFYFRVVKEKLKASKIRLLIKKGCSFIVITIARLSKLASYWLAPIFNDGLIVLDKRPLQRVCRQLFTFESSVEKIFNGFSNARNEDRKLKC